MATALEQPGVERLVIDLRNNTGGDNTLLRPLLVALISSKVNRRGGIFAITGPTTFSAAQNFVNRLENYTEAIYVGEPTAENVNFYGDPAGITLPHSHLEAAVSQLWWQDKDPRDKRTATFPEIAIEPTFRDYVAGNDPALQYALTAPKPETIQEALEGSLSAGVDAVLARYKAYVSDPAHKFLLDPEPRVNGLGYRLLSAKRIPEAIVIFEVNARTHPNSWNAYDSLGEAYANARDKQRALDAYRKSVELNPENTNAKRTIEQIESGK
jgi:tetratricopeptide (TPR) repeat protein